jgi:hypothetical protein
MKQPAELWEEEDMEGKFMARTREKERPWVVENAEKDCENKREKTKMSCMEG